MDGQNWQNCPYCQGQHGEGAECEAARRAREASGAGAPDPMYSCIECGRRVHLDDTSVTTSHGRALCLRCSRRPGPAGSGAGVSLPPDSR